MTGGDGPWGRHALQWSAIGPPLRPSEADLAVVRTALSKWHRGPDRAPTTLVLGVTPELWRLTREGRRIAVDRSPEMIAAVWPGRDRPGDAALRADWRDLPLATGSVDLVLADGVSATLAWPAGQVELLAEVARVLRPAGLCVARWFVQAARRETVEEVLLDLRTGRVGGFHALKFRFAMALQSGPEEGVVLDDVWRAMDAVAEDLARTAAVRGWSPEEVRTIDAYRGVRARYAFPTLEALRPVVSAAGLSLVALSTPGYELGERCPTLVLEPGA